MAQIIENIGADGIQFTGDELRQFNSEIAKIEVKGVSLPKATLDFSDVEATTKKVICCKNRSQNQEVTVLP